MSRQARMRRSSEALLARIDALTLRERVLVFLTAMVVMGALWHLSLMQPLAQRVATSRGQIETMRARISDANQGLESQVLQLAGSGTESQAGLLRVQQRIEEINARLGDYAAELIDPAEMARVLEGVLKDQTNLRLIRIRNLGAESLSPAGKATAATFYKHGLEIEFEGSYLACLEYLQDIEKLPWRFYWQLLELDVEEYPRNRIRIEVSTLSLDQEWIGA